MDLSNHFVVDDMDAVPRFQAYAKRISLYEYDGKTTIVGMGDSTMTDEEFWGTTSNNNKIDSSDSSLHSKYLYSSTFIFTVLVVVISVLGLYGRNLRLQKLKQQFSSTKSVNEKNSMQTVSKECRYDTKSKIDPKLLDITSQPNDSSRKIVPTNETTIPELINEPSSDFVAKTTLNCELVKFQDFRKNETKGIKDIVPRNSPKLDQIIPTVRKIDSHVALSPYHPPSCTDVMQCVIQKYSHLKQSSEKEGVRIKDEHLISLAINLEEREFNFHAHEIQQQRAIQYDIIQRTIDRNLADQQHKEVIAVKHEQHDWLIQLITCRDKSMANVANDSFICALCCILVLTFDSILNLLNILNSFWPTKYTNWGIWRDDFPFYFLDRFCQCFTTGIFIVVLWGLGKVVTPLGLSPFMGMGIKTIICLTGAAVLELTSIQPLLTLVVLLAALCILSTYSIQYNFYAFKKSLPANGIPTVTSFNNCINCFDQMSRKIRCAHIAFAFVWVCTLSYTGSIHLVFTRLKLNGNR